MPLWLHESSHHSKTSEQVSTASMCSHSWYDGVVGTFTRGQDVRVLWIEGEVGSSVLYTSRIEKRLLRFRGRHARDTAEHAVLSLGCFMGGAVPPYCGNIPPYQCFRGCCTPHKCHGMQS